MDDMAEEKAYDDALRQRCLETMNPLLIENTLKNLADNLHRRGAELEQLRAQLGALELEHSYVEGERDFLRDELEQKSKPEKQCPGLPECGDLCCRAHEEVSPWEVA